MSHLSYVKRVALQRACDGFLNQVEVALVFIPSSTLDLWNNPFGLVEV
jgi:hypothetical protein